VEGHTAKIAKWLSARARSSGHDVELLDTANPSQNLSLVKPDRIVVIGSVHHQLHPESLEVFLTAKRSLTEKLPTLFLSVSLAAAFPEGAEDAKRYIEAFLTANDWKPTQTHAVAGALQYDEYDYFKEQIVQHIVLKNRKYEGPKGKHEFTDWVELGNILDRFLLEET
jgi:menaquinone-dependent protoporphyrinogen oxidase